MVFNVKSAIKNKDDVTNQPLQNANAITKRQFGRLLESEKGAYEVCQEFFKDSTMLKDKSKIADIAAKARMFARGRKSESGAMKFLIGHFAAFGSLICSAAITYNPLVLLLWIPHTITTLGIAIVPSMMTKVRRNQPYVSMIAPIFKAEDKIIKEVQGYLEHREFAEYKVSLGGNQAAKAQEAGH